MIETIYNFFYGWLFNSTTPVFMSAQGVEFTCIVFTITTLLAIVWLCLMPFKVLFRTFFN